eukprot:6214400-Pleurochrysis_carterae.AAC.1
MAQGCLLAPYHFRRSQRLHLPGSLNNKAELVPFVPVVIGWKLLLREIFAILGKLAKFKGKDGLTPL